MRRIMTARFGRVPNRWVLAVSLTAMIAHATVASAQLQFRLPDSTPNYAAYTTVDECFAAIRRIERFVDNNRAVWKDTMESGGRAFFSDSISPQAQTAAKDCSQRFDNKTIDLGSYIPVIELLLAAGRDDMVEGVVQRKLADARWDDTTGSGREQVLLNILKLYFSAKPVRRDMVQRLAVLFDQDTIPGRKHRLVLGVQGDLLSIAELLKDSSARSAAVARIIGEYNSLTDQDKAELWYQQEGKSIVARAMNENVSNAIDDSLRVGSKAYISLLQHNWEKARGNNGSRLPDGVGTVASPLEMNFLYRVKEGHPAGTGLRDVELVSGAHPTFPTPGKVSLIIFLSNGCHEESPPAEAPNQSVVPKAECWSAYATVRRLAQRFPWLDITIATKTYGYIAYSGIYTPEEEAKIQAEWWLGLHKLPARLAVTKSEFFLLDGYDRRRIDLETENARNYATNGRQTVGSTVGYLIDTDGTILKSGSVGRWSEEEYKKTLKVIAERKQ